MNYDKVTQGIMANAVNRNEVPEAIMSMIKAIAKLTLFYRGTRKSTAAKVAQTIVDLSGAYATDMNATRERTGE